MVCLATRYVSPKIYPCSLCCHEFNALRRKEWSLTERLAVQIPQTCIFSPYLLTSAGVCMDILAHIC